MKAPAQVGMLPVATNFHKPLCVRVQQFEYGYMDYGEIDDKLVMVRCAKPAQPSPPSAEDLRRLAPYERASKEVLEAQQRCSFDTEALDKAFAPLLNEVGDMQGIRAHTAHLLCNVLEKLLGWNNTLVALVKVPGDLRLLQAEVRKLKLNCYALMILPEWLGELVHLEELCLNGGCHDQDDGDSNWALTVLLEALGALQALKPLTLKNFAALRALPGVYHAADVAHEPAH
jgi:hypothetical protein